MRPALLLAPLLLAGACTSRQAYFSQWDDLDAVAAAELSAAGESVDLAIYSYSTSDDNPRIHQALLDVLARGHALRVVVDAEQYAEPSSGMAEALAELVAAGAAACTVGGYSGAASYAKMHDKFAVVDGRTVLTGSYNFTRSATVANYENLLVLHDPAVAADYAAAFEDIWSDPDCTSVEADR